LVLFTLQVTSGTCISTRDPATEWPSCFVRRCVVLLHSIVCCNIAGPGVGLSFCTNVFFFTFFFARFFSWHFLLYEFFLVFSLPLPSLFSRSVPATIQRAQRIAKTKHALDTAIILFAEHPRYLWYFQSRSQNSRVFWLAPRHGALEQSISRVQDFRSSAFTAHACFGLQQGVQR